VIRSNVLTSDEILTLMGSPVGFTTWSMNDFKENTEIKYRDNGLAIKKKYDNEIELDDALFDFLSEVSVHSEGIRSLNDDVLIEVLTAIYTEEIPAVYIDKRNIELIHRLNSSFDVDVYIT